MLPITLIALQHSKLGAISLSGVRILYTLHTVEVMQIVFALGPQSRLIQAWLSKISMYLIFDVNFIKNKVVF